MRTHALLSDPEESGSGGGFKVDNTLSTGLGVTLWGDLGLGWFGRLATALARRGISIRSANSMRQLDETWVARLHLAAERAVTAPETLDYFALCDESTHESATDIPAIDQFRLERTETNSLKLRIFAVDRIGLLSALCERIEFFGLFPERLQVTTQEGFIDDTIWLRGVAGHAPSTEAERAVRGLLATCVERSRTASG